MDLNELVVQEILESQREFMEMNYNNNLKKELLKREEAFKKQEKSKIKSLTAELSEKNRSIENLIDIQIENERLKRDFELISRKSKLEIEKAKTEIENQISRKLEDSISQKYELQLAEKEKQIAEVKKSANEAVKKASQGSMQLQGEVQEEAIENWLLKMFPTDKIHEVKKGALGADCLQIVNEFDFQNCGSIYYESKNTKEFNSSWISKFKKDIQEKNADIGVLVTNTLPKNQKRMKVIDGIYVCTFDEFKGLSEVLRNTIIEFSRHKIINDNVKDKKELLYDFLTSKEFVSGIERIIESFIEMNTDLEKEERIYTRNFSKRRSLVRVAQNNVIKLFTNFSSIAGPSIKNLDLLEYESNSSFSNLELLQRIAEE